MVNTSKQKSAIRHKKCSKETRNKRVCDLKTDSVADQNCQWQRVPDRWCGKLVKGWSSGWMANEHRVRLQTYAVTRLPT